MFDGLFFAETPRRLLTDFIADAEVNAVIALHDQQKNLPGDVMLTCPLEDGGAKCSMRFQIAF